MAASAPWSVKGIDPKAREVAKDLARRSGMTLGEWLNQMIMDDGASDDEPRSSGPAPYQRFEAPDHPGDDVLRASETLDRISARIEAAEHRTTMAIGNIDQSVVGVLNRLESAEREQTAVAARFEGAVSELASEQARLTARLRQIEQEAAGPRAVEAVRSMEGALAKVASHLYDGEAKADQRFAELRGELDGVNERLTGAPAGDTVSGEAVERISERLSEATERTTAAMKGLEASFAQLDQRLLGAEARIESGGGGTGAGLEQLAASLSARVDAVRAEMTEKIREAADGRFDRMERTLNEMTGHVEAAERRSANAIEKMGHEVLRMADTLGHRVQDVENRSADAIEQVGGEVARMASAMENRLARSDESGAQALEKLGGEIARITERLAERIANAERRSAQAMDDVGEQVSRVSERLQDRQERTSTELSERIRLSEERTARLLEDARVRIDQRLDETQRRLTEVATPPPPAYDQALFADPDVAPFGRERYDEPARPYIAEPADDDDLMEPMILEDAEPEARALADPEVAPFREEDFEPIPEREDLPTYGRYEPEDAIFAETARLEPEARSFGDLDDDDLVEPAIAPEDLAAADDEVFAAEHRDVHDEAEPIEALAPYEPPEAHETEGHEPEALEAEPLPAFAAMLDEAPTSDDSDLDIAAMETEPAPEPEPAAPLSTRELIEQARAAARSANPTPAELRARKANKANGVSTKGPFGHRGEKKPHRRGSTLTTALFVSGGAAALSVALVGYELVLQRPAGPLPTRVAEALGFGAPQSPVSGERPAAGEGQPMAAVALAPAPIGQITAPTQTEAQNEAAAEIYTDGVRRLQAHDNTGLDAVRKAANLGYAPAELFLGKLYESGGAGLKKDIIEARVWTERSAEGGDQNAMHNLALYYFEGTGGPKDLTQAANWFHRAADLGLVDSQYNLARLYEEGFGVAENPAEAYKWYLIAAHAGDAESRTAAQRLKSQLSPEAQSAAERAAQGFQPEGPHAATQLSQANVTSGAADITTAQKGLSRLGYYQGPYDGVSSPALSLAIAAYQRDQGLPSTGTLDSTVTQKLSAAAQ